MPKSLPNLRAPFKNESEVLTLGDFSVENRLDRVSLFGSLDLTLDQEGQRKAKTLLALLQNVVTAMEAQPLPERLSVDTPIVKPSPL